MNKVVIKILQCCDANGVRRANYVTQILKRAYFISAHSAYTIM